MNLALLAAAGTGIQVGAAIVATRLVVADVPPLTLALLRYAIGFLCLLPFALSHLRAQQIANKTHWEENRPIAPVNTQLFAINKVAWIDFCAMAALGIGQFGVLIALLNFGLQRVDAAQAALIFSLFPLLTLLGSAALGREATSLRLGVGVVLSIVGVAVSLIPKLTLEHPGDWWGELAVLASACVGATCSVLYRPYLQRYPTVPVSAFAMLASVLFLAVLALPEQWPTRVTTLSTQTWAVIAFIGISSGIGYFLWLYALKHETPTRVTIFLALNPVTAGVMGSLLLQEIFDVWLVSATALIIAGLWLATRGKTG